MTTPGERPSTEIRGLIIGYGNACATSELDRASIILDKILAALGALENLYEKVCDWNNYGPPHQIDETDPGSIVGPDGEWEPFTKAMLDALDPIDTALNAGGHSK